jgi:putative addiction module killer protein
MYLIGYNNTMTIVRETDYFKNWIVNLKDRIARSIINARIRRLSLGNKGDSRYIGNGVSELKIDYGSGYRVYYTNVGQDIVILLCGGDKSSQNSDIEKAKLILQSLEQLL